MLAHTLRDWLEPLQSLQRDANPPLALAAYLRAKMALSAQRPDASRVFANELLHGAPVLGDLMRTELRAAVRAKAAVIDGWVAAGSSPVIKKDPGAAGYSHAVWEAATKK